MADRAEQERTQAAVATRADDRQTCAFSELVEHLRGVALGDALGDLEVRVAAAESAE